MILRLNTAPTVKVLISAGFSTLHQKYSKNLPYNQIFFKEQTHGSWFPVADETIKSYDFHRQMAFFKTNVCGRDLVALTESRPPMFF
jgi:hypothetical protein